MSKVDAQNEVLRYISQIADLPHIVWEGLGDLSTSSINPRIEIQRGPSRDDLVGHSSVTLHTGEVQIVVVVPPKQMYTAQQYVRLLEDALDTHTRIGDILIVSPLDVRPSLSESGELRVPTYTRYKVLI